MIMFIGMLMVIDGIWSLVTAYNTHYPVCPWYFDAGRVIRAGVGAALIILSLLLRFQYEIAWANAGIKNEPKNTVGDASWYSQRYMKRVKHTASGGPSDEAKILESIRMPSGFSISIFAKGVEGARSLAQGEKGTIFVGRSVYELTSEVITYLKQNGVGDRVIDIMLKSGKKY